FVNLSLFVRLSEFAQARGSLARCPRVDDVCHDSMRQPCGEHFRVLRCFWYAGHVVRRRNAFRAASSCNPLLDERPLFLLTGIVVPEAIAGDWVEPHSGATRLALFVRCAANLLHQANAS